MACVIGVKKVLNRREGPICELQLLDVDQPVGVEFPVSIFQVEVRSRALGKRPIEFPVPVEDRCIGACSAMQRIVAGLTDQRVAVGTAI